MEVLETTFYCYARYAADCRPALKFGNFGLLKLQEHSVQGTATLRCILDRTVDHMPHKT
jgi:hypothetical protein